MVGRRLLNGLLVVTVMLGISMLLEGTALSSEGRLAIEFEKSEKALSPQAKALLAKHARTIEGWASEIRLVDAVSEQNRKRTPASTIRKIDRAWIAGGEANGLPEKLMSNGCAERLRALMAESSGYKEGFVMDGQGALVCMTQRTSDYWQGDEAKWQRSFNEGRGGIPVGAPRFDDSAKTILSQISLPIMQDGRAVEAITVGKTVKIYGEGRVAIAPGRELQGPIAVKDSNLGHANLLGSLLGRCPSKPDSPRRWSTRNCRRRHPHQRRCTYHRPPCSGTHRADPPDDWQSRCS